MAKNFIEKDYFEELVKPVGNCYEFNLVEVFKESIVSNDTADKTFNKVSEIAKQLGDDGYTVVNGKALKNFIKSWSSDKELSTTESHIMKAFLSLVTDYERYERY
jgi:hypothetical protein